MGILGVLIRVSGGVVCVPTTVIHLNPQCLEPASDLIPSALVHLLQMPKIKWLPRKRAGNPPSMVAFRFWRITCVLLNIREAFFFFFLLNVTAKKFWVFSYDRILHHLYHLLSSFLNHSNQLLFS